MCSNDETVRWNATVAKLHAELDVAAAMYEKLYTENRDNVAALQSEREMYQMAVRTIMSQAREIRQLKQTIAVASAIAKGL